MCANTRPCSSWGASVGSSLLCILSQRQRGIVIPEGRGPKLQGERAMLEDRSSGRCMQHQKPPMLKLRDQQHSVLTVCRRTLSQEGKEPLEVVTGRAGVQVCGRLLLLQSPLSPGHRKKGCHRWKLFFGQPPAGWRSFGQVDVGWGAAMCDGTHTDTRPTL